MALYSSLKQDFGLKKEGTRGTAESGPDKWYPTRGLPEFNYFLQHLKDEGIRNVRANFPPVAGPLVGEAKIPLYADPMSSAEFFYSLLSGISSAQQASTAAYKHIITQHATLIQPIAYTWFQNRGLNVLKYNRGCVKKISLKSGPDNLVEMDVDGLFEAEASGAIGSVSYPTQRYFGFNKVDFKLAGSSNTDVKDWNLGIDNGAFGHRVLNLSQNVADILAPGNLMIDGGMTIYFQSATERDKFIANTATTVTVQMIGANIESTYYYTISVILYDVRYKAFPYGEDNNLLAAKASFEGHYSVSDSKAIQVEITNTVTAY